MVSNETSQLLTALDGNLNLFELLLENCQDIMTLHKPDSTYLYASRIVEDVTGFTQKQMVGQTVYDFSHPDFEEQIRNNDRRINAGECFLTRPFKYRCANGDYKWFESRTKPLVNDRGKVTLVILSFRDISSQSSIAQLLSQYHQRQDKKAHYKQYLLEEEHIQPLLDKLTFLLDKQHIYLDPDLSLETLAEQMNIHPKFLSYLLNVVLKSNFYHLLNSYRIEEAKKMLVDPSYKHLSITGIAFESGFNSKSAFYKVFKKFLHKCPKEFLAS